MSTDAIISVLQELEKAANTDDLVYQIDVWSWAVDAMVLTAGRGQIEYLLHYGLPGEAKKQERASRRLLDRFERECRMRGIEESRYITQVLKGDFSHPHAKEEMFSSPAACLVDGEIKYALERLREAVISGATGDEPNDAATATPKGGEATLDGAAVRMGEGEDSREVFVFGKSKGEVTKRQAAFLRILIARYPDRVKGVELERKASQSHASTVLAQLKGKDDDFDAAILMAEEAYGRYGLASISCHAGKKVRKKVRRVRNPVKS